MGVMGVPADDLRAQLVKTLWDAPYDQEDQADALLPLVLAYAARELRAAAANSRAMGLVAAEDLIRRAQVLEHGHADEPPRCMHGRYRIDPCLGCGRRYQAGEMVGPFLTYEPGELAQPGTYGPETFDRG